MTATPDGTAPPLGSRRAWTSRRRIRAAAGGGVAIVVLGAAALAARGFGGDDGGRPVATNLPPATATVTRTTLTQTERVEGTLGYGASATVIARKSAAVMDPGADPGANPSPSPSSSPSPSPSPTEPPTTNTLTWLPAAGTTVQPGQPVYKVDNRPVVLLAGDVPLYRVLAVGVSGPDVAMLESNLRAFGYSGFTADSAFTSATASAVKSWQKKLRLKETGTVDVNQVVVAPGPIRVAELKAAVGADASGEVLIYTGTTRVVTIPLEVTRQHLVHIGLTGAITLPDGKKVTGTVESMGTVANTAAGSDSRQTGPPTVDVLVSIADQAALGPLDGAPVDLTLVVAERKDVLTVPVAALVALAEGGYGVQLVEGSTTRYVAVEPGMFAGGQVEVSGNGIAEGVTVGVPA